jgi:hypothetical protein
VSDRPYRIERRTSMLASALRRNIDVMRDSYRPPGQRPPFKDQLSETKALDFWLKHRHDELGARTLASMDAGAIMELDQALSAYATTQTPETLYGGDL